MGTNYYVETNKCTCCGRSDTQHIGKSSGGWTFSFRGYEQIRSYAEWVPILKAGRIYDEYGGEKSFDAFDALVQAKRTEPNNHARQYGRDERFESWLDPEGHSFSEYEFS